MSAPLSHKNKRCADAGLQIDPWQAVRSELSLEGEAYAEDLPRLADALISGGGTADWPARYSLHFGRGADGYAMASGRALLTFRPVCQRCLGEVAIPLDAPIALALIRHEAKTEAIPDHLDPLEVGERRIRSLDLVEDELLLSIPQVPVHPLGACQTPQRPRVVPEEGALADQGVEASENPFAVLAGLK